MTGRPTDEQLRHAIRHLAGDAGDLSLCPYYAGRGDRICFQLGICADPNGPEPQCITCVPSDKGWPLERHPEVWTWMLDQMYPTEPPDAEFTAPKESF